MDDFAQFGVLFVIITNALMIVGLIYTFVRVTTTADETRTMLTLASGDLIETGRGLHGMGDAVDKLIERLASAERHAAALLAQRPEAVPMTPDPAFEARLIDALRAADADALRERHQLRDRLDAILARLDQPATAGAPHALGMPVDNEGLRNDLLAWQSKYEHQQLQTASAEERAAKAENSAQHLAHELTEAHRRLIRFEAEEGQSPETSLQDAKRELEAMREMLAKTTDMLKRTQVEKEFIEDRFLDLDNAAGGHPATADAAPAEAAATAA